MNAFLLSTAVVALAEIGDKSQLLALVLAARYGRPGPIIAGIFAATLLNNMLAGIAGTWLGAALDPGMLRWLLGLSFLGMAVWMLLPERFDAGDANARIARRSVFTAAFLAFLIAETGDKTQIATIVLAAHYEALLAVVAGTTLGMLIANMPVVFLGKAAAGRLPVRAIRLAAALLFAALGAAALLGGDATPEPRRTAPIAASL